MIRTFPQHGYKPKEHIQIFHQVMNSQTKPLVDVAAGGTLMSKCVDDLLELLEDMAQESSQWPTTRIYRKKVVGIHEVDTNTVVLAKLEQLTKWPSYLKE